MFLKFILSKIGETLIVNNIMTNIYYLLSVIFVMFFMLSQLNIISFFLSILVGIILFCLYKIKNQHIYFILIFNLILLIHLYTILNKEVFSNYLIIILFLPMLLTLSIKNETLLFISYIGVYSILIYLPIDQIEIDIVLLLVILFGYIICFYLLSLLNSKNINLSKQKLEKMNHEINELKNTVLTQYSYDQLTGLLNKDSIEKCIEYYIQEKQQFTFILLNLDRLRVINSSYGIKIGDRVITEIGRRLMNEQYDYVARIRGDEFAILLKSNTKKEAIINAKQILKLCSDPIIINNKNIMLSASLGIVFSDERFDIPEEYIRQAEISMFEAKDKGKNTYQIFNLDLGALTSRHLQLENDLKNVLSNQELKLVYQPIISLNTGEINSFEALIRWFHPTLGLISPNEFIKIAEQTGLIIPIGEWVFREICTKIIELNQKYAISFNLSIEQFKYPHLINHFKKIVEEMGVKHHLIHIEITESSFIDNITLAKEVLRGFKKLGFKIHLDDFGTGYSSLSYLCTLPIDTVKIDRSFIQSIFESEKNYNLVKSIIYMSFSLQLTVIAEGIEVSKQLDILKEMGCTLGQGYYISKPLYNKDLLPYIKNTR